MAPHEGSLMGEPESRWIWKNKIKAQPIKYLEVQVKMIIYRLTYIKFKKLFFIKIIIKVHNIYLFINFIYYIYF